MGSGAGTQQAGRWFVGNAVAIGVGDRDAVAVIDVGGHDLAEIVVFQIGDRAQRCSVFRGLHARLGGDQSVAPVVEVIVFAGRCRAAGILDFLGEVSVADPASIVAD